VKIHLLKILRLNLSHLILSGIFALKHQRHQTDLFFFWGFLLFLMIFGLAFPCNNVLFPVSWDRICVEHLRVISFISAVSSMKF